MSHQAGKQLFSSEALIPPHVGLPGSPGQSINIDSYCELLHPVPDETRDGTNEDGAGGEQQLTPRGRAYQVCDVVCRFANRPDVLSIDKS
jgi:hypothetical protein